MASIFQSVHFGRDSDVHRTLIVPRDIAGSCDFGGFGSGLSVGIHKWDHHNQGEDSAVHCHVGHVEYWQRSDLFVGDGLRGTVASNIPMTNEFIGYLGAGYIGPIPFPVIEMTIWWYCSAYLLSTPSLVDKSMRSGAMRRPPDCPGECGFSQVVCLHNHGCFMYARQDL